MFRLHEKKSQHIRTLTSVCWEERGTSAADERNEIAPKKHLDVRDTTTGPPQFLFGRVCRVDAKPIVQARDEAAYKYMCVSWLS